MEHTSRTRAIATVLALLLAVGSVSAVAATASTTRVTHELPPEPPVSEVLAAEGSAGPIDPVADPAAGMADPAAVTAGEGQTGPARLRLIEPAEPVAPAATASPQAKVAKASPKSTPKPKASAKATAKATAKPKPAITYSGRNHVWIPSLGINRSVQAFPCSRSRAPDNYMYRWGCAGANNVYLMGHAYGVMKPLHDAYVAGRLRTGIKAWYADARGRVHVFAVSWWKVVRPTTAASWAWAAQSRSSMTLQTCVGKNSAYRLMVRLVEVGR